MIEAGILIALTVILIVLGYCLWRFGLGKARGRLPLVGRISALTVGTMVLMVVSTYKFVNARRFQVFGELIPRVNTSKSLVALTFDDGPGQSYTSELLSILADRKVKATFFVIGKNLEQFPSLGTDILSGGHELGNHTYSHKRMVFKDYDFIRTEIEKTDQLIRKAGYAGEIHFRAPNAKKLLLLPLFLSRVNKKHIFWDVEPDSYRDVADSHEKIIAHVLSNTTPGSIIILHAENPGRKESLKAVAGIIDGLRKKGFEFVTVSELIGTGDAGP